MNKSVVSLIVCLLVNSIVDLFVHTFLTAHLLTLSGNDIAFMAKFYIIAYVTLGLGFLLLLPIMKKVNRAFLLRMGGICKAGFLLLVVLLSDSILTHFVWLAVLLGFFDACFWSGANTLKNRIVESNKIKGLMSTININSKIVGIVFPVLFGLSIDAWSFNKIAIVILCLMSVQIVFSILVKEPKIEGDKKASLKSFYYAVKDNEQQKIVNNTFIVLFFRGFQFFLPFFLTYLIIELYGTNTSLGILTTVASVVAIVLLVAFNAIKKADRAVWIYVLFAIMESASLVLAVIFMSKLFIIIFQMVSVAVTLVADSMVEELRGISIKNASLDSFMPEAMAVGETYLNIGRVLGFALLMMIGIFNSFVATMIISGVFVLGLFVYLIFLGIVKNKVYQHQIEHKNMEEENKMAE